MIDTKTVSSDKLLSGRSKAVCEINIAEEGEAGDDVINNEGSRSSRDSDHEASEVAGVVEEPHPLCAAEMHGEMYFSNEATVKVWVNSDQ